MKFFNKRLAAVLVPIAISLTLLSGCAAHTGALNRGDSNFSRPVPVTVKDDGNQILQEVLDNGMVVIIKERHDSPVVTVQARVQTGSIYENEYLGSGISHAVEHMLFKNTTNRGIGEIAREIHNAGGQLNGYTTWDHTVFHCVVASRYFDTALDVISDSIMNSVLDEEEWEKEKKVILREIDMNADDPGRFMSGKFWKALYTRHPYRNPVIGQRDLFSGLTIDDLRNYYQERYVPNNMIFTVVGDVDKDEVLARIKETFKEFTSKSLPYVYIAKEPRQVAPREYTIERDVKVTRLSIGYHTVDLRSPDLYALDVMAMILGQGRTSRLFQNVKEKNLVHSVHAWSYTPDQPGVFGISAELELENLDAAGRAITTELERFQIEPVTASELQGAKQRVISNYRFSGQTVQGIARELMSDYSLTGSLDFSRLYVEGINKVTAEDILEVANRYFDVSNRTQVVMRPRASQKEISAVVANAAGFNFKESFKTHKLSNGITVYAKENFTAPIVSVQTFLLGGVRYEDPKQNGISSYMQSMLMRGTKNRTANELAAALESMGASIGTHSGYNSCYNQLSVLSADFDKGLALLADVILEPSFNEEEIEKLRSDILVSIRKQDEEIFPVASKLYRATYFTNHPYRFRTIGSEDSVKTITRNDLVAFYNRIYNPSSMVIVVAGAVKADEAFAKLEKYFAAMPAREAVKVTHTPQAPPTEAKRAVKTLPGKEQAILMLGFPGTDIRQENRFVFEVMGAILSGQGNRLFQELRDVKGLAYYVGTSNITGLEQGSYLFYIGTRPETLEQSEAAFWLEINKLIETPVTEEELARAKRTLIGQKEIGLQTNASQAFAAGLDEIYDLGYDNLDNYAQSIEKVTAKDIQDLAYEKFKKENSVTIIVKPETTKQINRSN